MKTTNLKSPKVPKCYDVLQKSWDYMKPFEETNLTSVDGTLIRITVNKDPCWGNIYAYLWDDNGNEYAPWPGIKLDFVPGLYQHYLDYDPRQWPNIIFNDGF